jgi:hypothetical protein
MEKILFIEKLKYIFFPRPPWRKSKPHQKPLAIKRKHPAFQKKLISSHLFGDNFWPPGSRSGYSQCCGSVTFWYGSGFADPCLWPMDPDPDIFVLDLLIAFWRYIYIIFLRQNVIKKSQGLFLLDEGRIRIQEAQQSTDPDPQHCSY